MPATPPIPLAPGGGPAAGRRLSEVLRALRRHRRMRPADVARAMGMPLRSYEHFEGGKGRLNLERLNAFADATDTDAFAILASLSIGSPAFAVRCADNKLMLIMMMALQDFDVAASDDLATLQPRALIAAFTGVFADLQDAARQRDPLVEEWLARTRPPCDEDPQGGSEAD